MAFVRYIVDDIEAAVGFYRDRLGFAVAKHNPGKFAALTLDDLHLFLNAPGAAAPARPAAIPAPAAGTAS